MSFLKSLTDRVRQGLRRTRDLLDDGLDAVLAVGRPVDEALLEELEEALIAADLGAAAAGAFVTRVRDEIKRGRAVSSQDVKALLRAFVEETLAAAPAPLDLDARPTVILMLGVNGAGKTTSTGKLAASLKAVGQERDDRRGRHVPRRRHRAARGMGPPRRRWRSSARPRAPIPPRWSSMP